MHWQAQRTTGRSFINRRRTVTPPRLAPTSDGSIAAASAVLSETISVISQVPRRCTAQLRAGAVVFWTLVKFVLAWESFEITSMKGTLWQRGVGCQRLSTLTELFFSTIIGEFTFWNLFRLTAVCHSTSVDTIQFGHHLISPIKDTSPCFFFTIYHNH